MKWTQRVPYFEANEYIMQVHEVGLPGPDDRSGINIQLTAKPLNAIAAPLAAVEGCLFFCDWLPRHRQRVTN